MPVFSLTREVAQTLVAAVEQALSEGAPPPGHIVTGRNTQKGCLRVACDRLGLEQQTLRNQIGSPERPGYIFRHFGILVDWSKYRPIVPPLPDPPAFPKPPPAPVDSPSPPTDPVVERRLRDENARLRLSNKDLERRIAASEDYRSGVLGLAELPPTPVAFPPRDDKPPHRETIVLCLSDLHWGEKVDLGAMDGLNSYSVEIARKRLGRWTNAVIDLATKHWSGLPPDRIILILGGDIISGAIHADFLKTDELRPLPAVRDAADHLRHAILTIKANIDCPLDIISLPGNHGRSTLKAESKDVATTSHDVLVSDFLEMGLRDHAQISFYAPPSPDALFSVYGWRVLCSHGDRIGSRGGQGFIGPAATAARGMKRMIADYAARGVHVDLILLGHFHTKLVLEEGLINGCLVGPSEFSRDGRYRPQPATQLFFCMHPRRLMTQVRWIEVGHPEEGSLYEPPPPDRPLRPRFRIKAVTERIS